MIDIQVIHHQHLTVLITTMLSTGVRFTCNLAPEEKGERGDCKGMREEVIAELQWVWLGM